MPVCDWMRSASEANVAEVEPRSTMRSGLAFNTTSTLALLPRPVRRPSSGSCAYFGAIQGISSSLKARVQPMSVSGARAKTSTEAGGPAA
jgi:hypothetical protein